MHAVHRTVPVNYRVVARFVFSSKLVDVRFQVQVSLRTSDRRGMGGTVVTLPATKTTATTARR